MALRSVDTEANRRAVKWMPRELAGRLVWELCQPLFAWSPRQFWLWRRLLLRAFGARIGRHVHIFPSVSISVPWNLDIGDYTAVGDRAILYSLGAISVEAAATISQGVHICAGTHDHRLASMPLVRAPVSIGEGAWVCADAFVGPGVSIGRRAVVGARAVAIKDVAEGATVVGNPAVVVGAQADQPRRWRCPV